MKTTITTYRGRRRALLIAVLSLPAAPVIAGIATSDLLDHLRATPRPTMGALEVSAPAPAAPTGLAITTQRVSG